VIAEVQARPRVLVLSDQWSALPPIAEDHITVTSYGSSATLPRPEELAAADMAVIIAPLGNGDRAFELVGTVKLALEQGATVVFAYSTRLQSADPIFLAELGDNFLVAGQLSGHLRGVATDPPAHAAFRDYLTLHGQTDLKFTKVPEEAEVLAHAVTTMTPCQTAPTAIVVPIGRGYLYFVPWHVASDIGVTLERLVAAVSAHLESQGASEPSFFDELRLPGEEQLLEQITQTEERLSALRDRLHELTRHKRLLGHLQDQALEAVVIEELNVVFNGSGWRAIDIEERYGEDFRLEDEAGNEVALGESKADARGVQATHVSKLNDHRAERVDAGDDVEHLPGLLVVNVFRNDDALRRRRDERLDPKVVRSARRANVLVLRTWDLYALVARRLVGTDESGELIGAMTDGGWLEVTEQGPTLHTGERAPTRTSP
jgi:hypothetical protein